MMLKGESHHYHRNRLNLRNGSAFEVIWPFKATPAVLGSVSLPALPRAVGGGTLTRN